MLKGRVIIVEDQPNFRKGLSKMIEHSSLSWEVVGEASNGQEALELLSQVNPDLVLTDIRMPIMDGIEFVGHLRQNYPDMIVVILTGYKNFEYAQSAVRLGALDLLIKPCTEQDVSLVLNKAFERFYGRYMQGQKLMLQQRQEQDQSLRDALLGLPYLHEHASSINQRLLNKELWMLKLNNQDLEKKNDRKSDLSLIQYAFANIVEELLKHSETDAELLLVENDCFVLLSRIGVFEDTAKQEIENASLQYLNIHIHSVSIGLSLSVDRLSEQYQQARKNVDDSDITTLSDAKLSLNQALVKEKEMELMSAIMMGQASKLQQLLEHQVAELANKRHEDMKIEAMSLSIAMHATIQKHFESVDNGSFSQIASSIPQAEWTEEKIIGWVKEEVRTFLLLFNNWQVSKSENLIERAIKYIEQHYNEECRLADVAAHISLNPSYFSVLFKKATGESFTRYVVKFRMDKAALLLRNTDMKIFEIASAVGFDEPNYFTNVFKQQFQLSPKEYRNLENL